MTIRQKPSDSLTLYAPLSGWLMPVTRVPDPVFSEKMLGDGIAIDPLCHALNAPCEGVVIQLPDSGHAVTLQTPNGVELLIHIGLDTVMLKGEGFKPRVKEGDKVSQGQVLIEFDPDYLACHARSLVTAMVVTNAQSVESMSCAAEGHVEQGTTPVMTLTLDRGTALAASEEAIAESLESHQATIIVPNPNGLHARPAAVLAETVKPFNTNVTLSCHGREANALSVASVMGLNTRLGDEITVKAQGQEAVLALDAVIQAIRKGLGETVAESTEDSTVFEEKPLLGAGEASVLGCYSGIVAVNGLATGVVHWLSRPDIKIAEYASDSNNELSLLAVAIDTVRQELQALQSRMGTRGEEGLGELFAAQTALLDDPDVLKTTKQGIQAGKTAAFSWKQAVDAQVNQLRSLDNPLLAGRAIDIEDSGFRVLLQISGIQNPATSIPDDAIILADDLAPADVLMLDQGKVKGLCTLQGGATSHAAILAKSLSLPMLVGLGASGRTLINGSQVILDTVQGRLQANPDQATLDACHERIVNESQRREQNRAQAHKPALTLDGEHVEVLANIGNLNEARNSVAEGGEGVGLLRSEFLFLNRVTEPNEAEQADCYQAIAQALGRDRPLIIRTLDVGGDKPLPYLPIPKEDNPFLGERGIRVGINRPGMLRRQVRAILTAAKHCQLRIMLPMVSSLAEFRAVKTLIREEQAHLGVSDVSIGIMVEVPSAALLADRFAQEVDFFSIGTNDLTQYTLAIDRGHARLAARADGLDPSVLQLIAMTTEAAHRHGKWVGVCGGLAGDEQAVPLLLGLGVDELSVSVPAIADIKAAIRRLSMQQCREMARQSLSLESAAEVRQWVKNQVHSTGK
ncbi:MAG: phosphoenolpyruvate--protein phosphotransferase [Oceanospirillales bacterium LUC14_002_19_P2]|nr:MAG: phosphoenolpyruvate--protein phosphotransferase [Oceanospirillales bacterium LUC14_002_19_P2]